MRAMFTMFQVMTMDFSGIARAIMFDHSYPLAAIFFIPYIFIAGIVMTNVVVAILLDRYLAAMDDNDAGTQIIFLSLWKSSIVIFFELRRRNGKIKEFPDDASRSRQLFQGH